MAAPARVAEGSRAYMLVIPVAAERSSVQLRASVDAETFSLENASPVQIAE
jgi:hypothetical protein